MFSYRPKASAHHLKRARLLESLPDDAGYAVWLNAPYGYGKTVLASQWADQLEQEGWRVIWLAVGGRQPKPLLAQELGLPEASPWGILLDALWATPTLLVIEDLETLEDHEGLSPILKDLRGLVLLASRGPINSSELPRLVTAHKLVQLNSRTLGFSEKEAEALYAGDQRASDVWRRTQGWPLPLHFALLTGEMPERTGLLEGMRESLAAPEWDEALLLASVAHLPLQAATPATERLALSGFALLTAGGYRLHALVAENILRAYREPVQAVLEREQERLSLLERAEAAARCGHEPALQDALEEVSGQLWRLAPASVLRWDEQLGTPPSALRDIAVGGALKVLGRHQESAQRLEAALATGTLTPDQQLIALGELCWVQAAIAPELATQTVLQGEALLDAADPERAGRFLTNTFIVDIMASRFDDAIGKLERALEYFPEGSQYRLGARINLALCRWDQQGEFDSRLRTQIDTLPDVWRLYPSDAPGQCRDVAMLYGWLGELDNAREYFLQALDGARLNPLVGLEVEAALAQLDGNLEPFAELLTKAEAWGDAYTQEIITMHGVTAMKGDAAAARRFYERSAEQGGLAAAAYAQVLAVGQATAGITADANAQAGAGTPADAVAYANSDAAADTEAVTDALRLLDDNLQRYPDRPRQLYLRAARYRVTRAREDLTAFLELTLAGARLLPGFVPLSELPQGEPELALAYPLPEVALSGWNEAVRLRAAELQPLQLTVLGEFRLHRFGEELQLTDRQRQLIALFTLGLSREAAGEAMWPETSVAKQRNNLGVQLSALRKELEPWGFRTYVLEGGLRNVRSDYDELNRALKAGSADQVLDLHREPLAPGLTHEPIEEERRRLREDVVRLLLEVGRNAEPDQATVYLNRVMELDPLNEDALQELIKHLLKRGRRQEAGRRYQAFCTRLTSEMGLQPLPETSALLETVR